MKMYIIRPGVEKQHDGEGLYALVTEDGRCIATHFCSHVGFAAGDLWERRPDRKKSFPKKLGVDELTLEGVVSDEKAKELHRLNLEWAAEEVKKG